MLHHQHKRYNREIIPIEEDEHWVLGGSNYTDAKETHLVINVFCKMCMWYVGFGPNSRHKDGCAADGEPMNSSFLKKALLMSPYR